MIGNYSGTLMR